MTEGQRILSINTPHQTETFISIFQGDFLDFYCYKIQGLATNITPPPLHAAVFICTSLSSPYFCLSCLCVCVVISLSLMFCSLSLLFFVLSLSLSFFFFSSLSLPYQVHAIYYVGRLCVSEPFNEIHWHVCLCLCLPPSLCLSFFFSLSLQHKVPALHFIVQVCVRETFYWRILVIKVDRGFFIIYCATRTAFFC